MHIEYLVESYYFQVEQFPLSQAMRFYVAVDIDCKSLKSGPLAFELRFCFLFVGFVWIYCRYNGLVAFELSLKVYLSLIIGLVVFELREIIAWSLGILAFKWPEILATEIHKKTQCGNSRIVHYSEFTWNQCWWLKNVKRCIFYQF